MIRIQSKLTKKAVVLFSTIFLMQAIYIGILAGFIEQVSWRVELEKAASRVIRAAGMVQSQSILYLADLSKYYLEAVGHHEGCYKRMMKEKSFKQFPRSADIFVSILVDDPVNHAEALAVQDSVCVKLPKIAERLLSLKDRGSDIMRLEHEYDVICEHLDTVTIRYEQLEKDAGEVLNDMSVWSLGLVLALGFGINVFVALALYRKFIAGITDRLAQIFDDIIVIGSGRSVPERSLGDDELDVLAAELHDIAANVHQFQSTKKILLDNAASVACTIASDGRILSVGPGSAAKLGYAPTDLIGKRFASLRFYDESSPIAKELEKLFLEQVDIEFETTHTRADGKTIDLSWKARLSEGEDTAVLVAHDVTEQSQTLRSIKQRQEEFRSIVDRMPIAVVTTDEMFTITSINAATTEMFKYNPTDLLARDLGVLLTGATARSAQLKEITAVAENHPVETTVRSLTNDTIPVEFNIRSYEGSSQQKTYLATFRDVSVRTEIERVKRDFVSMISHDLRSPLTALFGTLEIMMEENNERNPEKKLALQNANSIVASLVSLINDFLDLEKFEAGLGVLEQVQLPIRTLIETTLKTQALSNSPVKVIPEDFDPKFAVKVDVDRMTFAIAHYVSFVKKYSKPGANIKIWLSVETPFATITITGEDFKLPQNIREASLSRYAFVPSDTDENGASSGLALALSRAIIQAHNGSVRFDDDENLESVTIQLVLSG
jgi:PAS domain S-box-containing protein